MKNDWRNKGVLVIVFVFAVAGCSSTQPDSIGTRTASLSLKTRATVPLYNCYELWEDTDADGVPDLDYEQIVCFRALDDRGNPRSKDAPIPWNYSLKITIIPAGSTEEVLAFSTTGVVGSSVEPGDLLNDFISLTDYDRATPTALPATRIDYPIYYLNGKEVTQGSRLYLSTVAPPVDPGETNILRTVPTFDFNLNTGDTVIVRARKKPVVLPSYIPQVPDPLIKLSAEMALAGVGVNMVGTPISTTADGTGFTTSFTVR